MKNHNTSSKPHTPPPQTRRPLYIDGRRAPWEYLPQYFDSLTENGDPVTLTLKRTPHGFALIDSDYINEPKPKKDN